MYLLLPYKKTYTMKEQKKRSAALNSMLWIMQVLLAVFLLAGTVLKFMPIEKVSAMMPWTGQVPAAMVRLLGVIDLLGAAGLVLPSLLRIRPGLTVWAAYGCVALMLCAIAFHVSRREAAVTGVNIAAACMAAFVAWGRRKAG